MKLTREERDAFDAIVLAAIQDGTRFGRGIIACVVDKEPSADLHAVDGALQRLRRDGRIQFDATTGWKVIA